MKGYLYTVFEAMHVSYISYCQIIMQFVVYCIIGVYFIYTLICINISIREIIVLEFVVGFTKDKGKKGIRASPRAPRSLS